jgi:hypothetical protein
MNTHGQKEGLELPVCPTTSRIIYYLTSWSVGVEGWVSSGGLELGFSGVSSYKLNFVRESRLDVFLKILETLKTRKLGPR